MRVSERGAAAAVTILGAGLAGLAAAQRAGELGMRATVYDKNPYVGGHAHSRSSHGFTFDEGPHVSFTRNPVIQALLANAVPEFIEKDAVVTNYWRGYWVRHPAQANLFGLPAEIVERCLVDMAEAQAQAPSGIASYADWCYAGLGRTFAEEFTFPYTRKYWTTDAANMTTDWVGTCVFKPRLQEAIRGALRPQTENLHYITHFRYPRQGGFGAYTRAVHSAAELFLGHTVAAVDLQKRYCEFENGRKGYFEKLISSLPLPELVRRIRNVPADILDAANALSCTALHLVNLGLDRREGLPEADWLYVYDEDILFARLNLPHRLSPQNAPDGKGSVQVEIYSSKYKPLPVQDVLNRTVEDLQRIGILERQEHLPVAAVEYVPYANVLFDHARARNLEAVRAYLHAEGVELCGRYGEWDYYWSDDSILSGWRAAERLAGMRHS